MFLEFNGKESLFYTKMPNSKIFIKPLMEQRVWGALVPWVNSDQKMTKKTNFSWNSFLGGVYSMQKGQMSKFVFDPIQASPYQKIYRDKRLLEFNFRDGLCYAEVPNSKKFIWPPPPLWSSMFGVP